MTGQPTFEYRLFRTCPQNTLCSIKVQHSFGHPNLYAYFQASCTRNLSTSFSSNLGNNRTFLEISKPPRVSVGRGTECWAVVAVASISSLFSCNRNSRSPSLSLASFYVSIYLFSFLSLSSLSLSFSSLAPSPPLSSISILVCSLLSSISG